MLDLWSKPDNIVHQIDMSHLRTELLELRSYALSMNDEVRKAMKEYNEELLYDVNGLENSMKHGKKVIGSELEDMRNDLRNQYIGMRSTMSAILSSKNRQEFTQPSQPYTTMMLETKECHQKVPCKQEHPPKREYQQSRQNQQQQRGTMNIDNENKIGCASASTPEKQFYMRHPPPWSQALKHHELSMHVVKQGIHAMKDGPSTANSMVRPVQAEEDVVSPQHLTGKDSHKEETYLGDAYRSKSSKARELWPNTQAEI